MSNLKRIAVVFIAVVLMAASILVSAQQPDVAPGFIDHGVAVTLAESYGCVGLQDGNGHNIVIAGATDMSERGWMLITDVDTGKSQQVYCPEGVPNSPNYGSLLARTGKLYTGKSNYILELDPTSRQWTHYACAQDSKFGAFMRLYEARDGTIWVGDGSKTLVMSYNPQSRELKFHGPMDAPQKYAISIGEDDAGWLYFGIGVAKWNIVAYNPQTAEKRPLIPPEERKRGYGIVHAGTDGKAYGKLGEQWYRLYDGAAQKVDEDQVAPKVEDLFFYSTDCVGVFPDGRKPIRYRMADKYVDIQDPATGRKKRIKLEYDSGGASIIVMAPAPDGKVYLNSAHVSRTAVYDPKTDVLEYKPGHIMLVNIATQGKYIFGGRYSHGMLYVFDTTKPWNMNPVAGRIEDGIEGPELFTSASSDDGKLLLISGNNLTRFQADDYGGRVHFKLQAPADGDCYLVIAPYYSPEYCTMRFIFDGKPIGKLFPANADTVKPGPFQTFGPMQLKAGEHSLSVRTVKAAAGKPVIGIGSLKLTPQKPAEFVTQPVPANPQMVGVFEPDINAPHGACPHPDGKHILISGKPGYGYIGGGIAIYNLETEQAQLLTHDQLIPNQTILSMLPLKTGNILLGSGIYGGHGAGAVEKEAFLAILDWETKKIAWKLTPFPTANEIWHMCWGNDGLIYAIANGYMLVVFDPDKRQVVHTAPIREYSNAARSNAIACAPDGNLYALFHNAIVRITPGTFEVEKIADAPGFINAGIAILEGRLYFAIDSHLWSLKL